MRRQQVAQYEQKPIQKDIDPATVRNVSRMQSMYIVQSVAGLNSRATVCQSENLDLPPLASPRQGCGLFHLEELAVEPGRALRDDLVLLPVVIDTPCVGGGRGRFDWAIKGVETSTTYLDPDKVRKQTECHRAESPDQATHRCRYEGACSSRSVDSS